MATDYAFGYLGNPAFSMLKLGFDMASMGQSMMAEATAATAENWGRMLGGGAEPARSWYRAPAPTAAPSPSWPVASWTANPWSLAPWTTLNPWVSPMFGQSSTAGMWPAMAPMMSMSAGAMPALWQSWLAAASPFAGAFNWMGPAMRTDGTATLTALAGLPAAVASDVASAYRSAGGHAVAQITYQNASLTGQGSATGNPWIDLGLRLTMAPFSSTARH